MNEMFDLATGVKTIRDTTGWWYRITPRNADSNFNYEVCVYLDGRTQASTYADTKRGARREARKIRDRFYKRRAMTPEIGRLT